MKVVKKQKKKASFRLPEIKLIQFRKNKYHKGGIEGENLPESLHGRINFKLVALGGGLGILATLLVTYAINYLKAILVSISHNKGGLMNLHIDATPKLAYFHHLGSWGNYFSLMFVAMCGIGLLVYTKLDHESTENVAYGQKGDSRFATLKEIQKQYKAIPEKEKEYDGVGGVPISHYKDKYYIDTDTVNTCVIGTSRSGKGETFVVPTIDILSRAKEKSNIIANDPKGELFAASKKTLEERGYRVLVLNIDDPMQSMSFNPLQLVIDAWRDGDYSEANKRANTLTAMLFSSGMGTDNEFFYSSAKAAVNAIILTICEWCFEHKCIEKITMYNVAQMLNELGSLFWTDEDTGREHNALDEYFNSLPQGNQAKLAYGSTSFAGDKAKGSILATASQGIEMFTSDLFGKMTSRSSIDLKEIGFPKSVQFKVDPKFVGKRLNIQFYHRNEKKELVKVNDKPYRQKIKSLGVVILPFDEKLQDGDIMDIRYADETTGKTLRAWYTMKFPKRSQDDYSTKVELTKHKCGSKFGDLAVNTLVMKYTDNPTAIFIVIPDYDPSNHVIGSIFINQLYTELASNCKNTKKKKCFRRVHFLLDEFGNMPAIDNMDGILTVCLGRNILFELILQSYNQLKTKYKEKADTIKENCQNHVLIMSTDKDTLEEISAKAGNKTIVGKSLSSKQYETDSSESNQADQVRIITPERISQLIEGEQVILRFLHRQDAKRGKIRPYPIFNTQSTNMPYRYQFLNKWFDTSNDINDIDIECDHINLSLIKNQIPFVGFIQDLATRIRYAITNNNPISTKDYLEYKSNAEVQDKFDDEEKKKIEELGEKSVKKKEYVEKLKSMIEESKKSLEELEDIMPTAIKLKKEIDEKFLEEYNDANAQLASRRWTDMIKENISNVKTTFNELIRIDLDGQDVRKDIQRFKEENLDDMKMYGFNDSDVAFQWVDLVIDYGPADLKNAFEKYVKNFSGLYAFLKEFEAGED